MIHPLIGGVIFRILHLLPVAQHIRVIQQLRRVTTPALWRSAMEPHLPYGLTTQEHTHPLALGRHNTVILLEGLTLIFQIDPRVAQGENDAEGIFSNE